MPAAKADRNLTVCNNSMKSVAHMPASVRVSDQQATSVTVQQLNEDMRKVLSNSRTTLDKLIMHSGGGPVYEDKPDESRN